MHNESVHQLRWYYQRGLVPSTDWTALVIWYICLKISYIKIMQNFWPILVHKPWSDVHFYIICINISNQLDNLWTSSVPIIMAVHNDNDTSIQKRMKAFNYPFMVISAILRIWVIKKDIQQKYRPPKIIIHFGWVAIIFKHYRNSG